MAKSKVVAATLGNGSSIHFNIGTRDSWMCYDPGSDKVMEANRAARGYGGSSDALLLASVASAFAYFVHDCPND